jgi:hypothetical protein
MKKNPNSRETRKVAVRVSGIRTTHCEGTVGIRVPMNATHTEIQEALQGRSGELPEPFGWSVDEMDEMDSEYEICADVNPEVIGDAKLAEDVFVSLVRDEDGNLVLEELLEEQEGDL